MNLKTIAFISLILLVSCTGRNQTSTNDQKSDTMTTDTLKQYGFNLDFLRKHVEVIELKNGNSSVAIVPAWQGRVMTSTAGGSSGFSFGWINRDLIASGRSQPHIMPFGGEERLWLGPEGGQFSIYFKKGVEFVYDKWQTPAFLDTIPFSATSVNETSASFTHNAEIENYSGTPLKFQIDRKVTLLSEEDLMKETGLDLKGISYVAYMSENKLTNKGDREWKKETGMLSIWMLGMFIPSPEVTVVIPFKQGDEKDRGIIVNDSYFGKISPDRLKIAGNNIYFRADGKSRGKIGLSPLRATGTMGSYDFENKILTLLICKLPEGKADYVNSAWQIQEDPYSGDAMNSYNDGPLEDGSQMGPFYELETSSPAAALKPGESITHSQITIHLTGDEKLLDQAAMLSLGVTLEEIKKVFE